MAVPPLLASSRDDQVVSQRTNRLIANLKSVMMHPLVGRMSGIACDLIRMVQDSYQPIVVRFGSVCGRLQRWAEVNAAQSCGKVLV